ncbi:hypothetical protein GGG16DRAFT_47111 [Schizophyllum commune]
MAHSVIIPRRTFFYAIGNTCADLLTETLPPEESLDLLLLGCGDPRSILYTTYADGVADRREFDITFCDIEPAIIARNVLLFTLLADTGKASDGDIWNIFYHFQIPEASLTRLQRQSSRLVEFSESLQQWLEGPYGGFIRPRTQQTLSDLRRFWSKYAATASFTKAQHQDLRNRLNQGKSSLMGWQRGDVKDMAGRSAGPFYSRIVHLDTADVHFKHYWKHGVVGGCATDAAALAYANPTFMYTQRGQGFCLHYGSDPVFGYHLAGILGPFEGNPPKATTRDLGAYARREFSRWCAAFRERITADVKFVLRPHVGDALALCRALGGEQDVCVSAYDSRPIVLENDASHPAPTLFNVIDTSNLADHIGLLNVLTSAAPLLRKSPTSTLHTNSLHPSAYTKSGYALLERLGADLTTFSLLSGLAPLPLLTKFTIKTSPYDYYANILDSTDMRQQHQPIAWKYPASGDQAALVDGAFRWTPVSVDAGELRDVLHRLYLHMFAVENIAQQLSKGKAPHIEGISNPSVIIYVRASYAFLLRFIKDRVRTEWQTAMDGLFAAIQADRTLIFGNNNYQDLSTHAHLLGVDSHGFFAEPFEYDAAFQAKPELFTNWKSPPRTVHVVLRIPRSAVQRLWSIDVDILGTPMLQCEIIVARKSQAIFSSVQLDFGTLGVDGKGEEAVAWIERDEDGWEGSSPVILRVTVPARMLDIDPRATKVQVSLRSTPQTAVLMRELGPRLALFDAELMGQDVCVLKDPPRVRGAKLPSIVPAPSTSQAATHPQPTSEHASKDVPSVRFTNGKISHIAVKVNLVSDVGKAALQEGGAATGELSPCTVQLVIGSDRKIEETVAFPFPVIGRDAKLRVARKSGYVEVIAPVAKEDPANGDGGYDKTHRTPTIFTNRAPYAWAVTYVDLDKQPKLLLSFNQAMVDWIQTISSPMFSGRELLMQRSHDQTDTWVNLKNSMAHFLMFASGAVDGKKCPAFSLCRRGSEDGFNIIFVNAIRLDLPAQSVVLDVCIVPLTRANKKKISLILTKFEIRNILMDDEEIKAWKSLLPTAVERCRTWDHVPGCAYVKQGIPLTLDIDESPICDCGCGKNIPDSDVMRAHRQAKPYATRAAIGLLYAVPYLEDSGKQFHAAYARASTSAAANKCAACGKVKGTLMTCGRCKQTKYCSRECQTGDWKVHKKICRAQGVA